MNETILIQVIKYLIAVLAAVLLGNGAVYLFNHMPAGWFCDYGEEPGQGKAQAPEQKAPLSQAGGAKDKFSDLYDPYTQRVKSTPWKYYFSMLFIVVGLYLVRDDWVYTIAVMLICWILLELAISDIKYRIVPDQLLVLLALSAIGTVQFHSGWQDMLYGAIAGLGIMTVTALIGKAMYRRDTVGGGDIKLFAALGLVLGVRGVLVVFVLSALLSGAHMVWMLARKKIKRKDTIPMVPYIALSAGVYLVFIWQGPLNAYLVM